MRDAFFLALRYLSAAPGQTTVLITGIAVALFLPLFTILGTEKLEDALLQRAQDTPVLVGAPGNEFDLTLSALYFSSRPRQTIPYAARRDAGRYGVAVPLHVASTVSGSPLVATDLEYLRQRSLTLSEGRTPALLGEVVAGSAVAEAFQISPGDTIRSDLTNLYNLAGAYPALLTVVGLLEPSGSPDDSAFFADVKTGWLLEGRLHGHDAITEETALDPEAAGNLEATAALLLFSELTEENRTQFHVHGDLDDLPVSAVLVFPRSIRRHDQLLGDYALRDDLQAVRPSMVIDRILGVVLQLRSGLSLYMAVVGGSTAAFLGLVVSLSMRLRRSELTLMRRIGCSRWAIPSMIAAELSVVLLVAVLLAAGLTAAALLGLSAVLLP